MKIRELAILFATAVALASCTAESAPNNMHETNSTIPNETGVTAKVNIVGSEETKSLLVQQQDIVILDVRTPGEYNAGHLQNAQLMDFSAPDFANRLETLDPAKTYLVYCAVGGRSGAASQLMTRAGFKHVFDANEGFSSLKSAGVPVE